MRRKCAAMVLGGPIALIDVGGLRILVDPTFDDAGWHGPVTKLIGPAITEDGPRDAYGDINGEVIGFFLSGTGIPTVYVSGDNASLRTVARIARRQPAPDVAVLFGGVARVPALAVL
jgi:hypothetical protein